MLSTYHYCELKEDAVKTQLKQWQQYTHSLHILVFISESEVAEINWLQKLCASESIRLSGAVFPCLIYEKLWKKHGILMIRLSQPVPQFLLPEIHQPDETAKAISTFVTQQQNVICEENKPTLFMIFNALTPGISRYVDEMYLALSDQVNYAGVNAGSETFQPMDCIFTEEICSPTGVLCLLLPEQIHFSLEHGFEPPSEVITATATEGDRIMNIDWEPAFHAYQELVRNHFGVTLTRENFYQYGSHFPLGILQANNHLIVRIPVGITEDQAIQCVGDVPANTPLVLLRGHYENCHQCAELLTENLDENQVEKNKPLLTFYCAGRKMFLGKKSEEELAHLLKNSGASILIGALSLGEIGSRKQWEYPLFHNTAILCAGWIPEC